MEYRADRSGAEIITVVFEFFDKPEAVDRILRSMMQDVDGNKSQEKTLRNRFHGGGVIVIGIRYRFSI